MRKILLTTAAFAALTASANATSFIDSFGRQETYPSSPQYGLSGFTVYLGGGTYANYQQLPPPPPVYRPPAYRCYDLNVC